MRVAKIATSFLAASSGTTSTFSTAAGPITKGSQASETLASESEAVSLVEQRSLSAGDSRHDPSRPDVCPDVSYYSSPDCNPEKREPPVCKWASDKVLMYVTAMDRYEIRDAEELVAMGCELPSTSCERLYYDLKALKKRGDCSISKVEVKFATFMKPSLSGKSDGYDKKTIIAATVGTVSVILFLSVGAYVYITDSLGLRRYYAQIQLSSLIGETSSGRVGKNSQQEFQQLNEVPK